MTLLEADSSEKGGIKLHVGGVKPHPDWKILNIAPGPHVDFVGTCTDLGRIESQSVSEIYASHVLEHLGYREELPIALKEFHRVLIPGGKLRISVPDFDVLIRLYEEKAKTFGDKWMLLTMIFGGQKNPFDFHKFGATYPLMENWLRIADFEQIQRVEQHALFDDTSSLKRHEEYISLNIICVKPKNRV